MVFVISQILFLLIILIGIIVWAYSDMPLAWREIAINSRGDGGEGNAYVMLKVLSVCLKILAVVFWIAGIACIVAFNIGGQEMGGFFSGGPGY
jgi:hypothetical protein